MAETTLSTALHALAKEATVLVKEKQALEKSLHELQSDSSNPTAGYYQQELSRIITEKITNDEAHQQELNQLQQQLSGISVSPIQTQICDQARSLSALPAPLFNPS